MYLGFLDINRPHYWHLEAFSQHHPYKGFELCFDIRESFLGPKDEIFDGEDQISSICM